MRQDCMDRLDGATFTCSAELQEQPKSSAPRWVEAVEVEAGDAFRRVQRRKFSRSRK